jgi:hypothetical protein
VVISKRVAWFLIAFGVWSWVIWPVFLKNNSRHHGMTGFFAVHLVLTVVCLALGTTIGILGIRAARTLAEFQHWPPSASQTANRADSGLAGRCRIA